MEAIKTEKTNEVQVDIVGVILYLLQRGVGEEWLSTHTPSSNGVLCSKMRTVTLYPQYMLSQHSINVSDEIM